MIRILSPFLGKKIFQRFFEKLYLLSLKGMNIGRDASSGGSGELNTIKYIKKELKNIDKPIIFDVGANIGNYTKMLLKVFQENANIHTFEPSKHTFNMLKSKLSDVDNVTLYNFGFGAENKQLTLYLNKKGSSLASIYNRKLDHFGIEMNLTEEINIETIDQFCTKNKIEFIHFLKIDVEGNEFNVLKGAENLLNNKKIQYIQFEFGGSMIDSRYYFQDFYYLLIQNYKIYRVLKDGIVQIKHYKEYYEIFEASNFLAELKS